MADQNPISHPNTSPPTTLALWYSPVVRAAACALALLLGIPISTAQDGSADPTFGTQGVVIRRPPSGTPYLASTSAYGVVVQPDGKLVVVGQMYNDDRDRGYVARLHPNGVLDNTYSGDGYHILGESLPMYHTGFTAALALPEGRVLVGGYGNRFMLLTRLTATGQLDPTFGQANSATLFDLSPTGSSRANDLIETSSGYVAAGTAGLYYGGLNVGAFAVARVLENGHPDPAFNGGAAVTIDFTPRIDEAHGVTEMSDGKLIVAGYAGFAGYGGGVDQSTIALARLLPDGSLDPAFLEGGYGTVDVFNGRARAYAVARGPGETFYVAGIAFQDPEETDFFVARFDADGSLDPSFGNGGTVVVPLPTGGYAGRLAQDIFVQGDGKVLVAGHVFARPVLVRLLPDGSLDPSFGTNGVTLTTVYSSPMLVEGGQAEAIALQPDGRIVVAGTATGSLYPTAFFVARYRNALVVEDEAPATDERGGMAVAPNPLRERATVQLTLPVPTTLRVALYDVLGREVGRLHDGALSAGEHTLDLDASTLPPGVYVLRTVGPEFTQSRMVTVAR